MHADVPYRLCKVGSGEQTHVLQENGRPLCDNAAPRNWERSAGEPSLIRDLNERAADRHYCRQAL